MASPLILAVIRYLLPASLKTGLNDKCVLEREADMSLSQSSNAHGVGSDGGRFGNSTVAAAIWVDWSRGFAELFLKEQQRADPRGLWYRTGRLGQVMEKRNAAA